MNAGMKNTSRQVSCAIWSNGLGMNHEAKDEDDPATKVEDETEMNRNEGVGSARQTTERNAPRPLPEGK